MTGPRAVNELGGLVIPGNSGYQHTETQHLLCSATLTLTHVVVSNSDYF